MRAPVVGPIQVAGAGQPHADAIAQFLVQPRAVAGGQQHAVVPGGLQAAQLLPDDDLGTTATGWIG